MPVTKRLLIQEVPYLVHHGEMWSRRPSTDAERYRATGVIVPFVRRRLHSGCIGPHGQPRHAAITVNRINRCNRCPDRVKLPAGRHEQAPTDWLAARADSRAVRYVPVTFHRV